MSRERTTESDKVSPTPGAKRQPPEEKPPRLTGETRGGLRSVGGFTLLRLRAALKTFKAGARRKHKPNLYFRAGLASFSLRQEEERKRRVETRRNAEGVILEGSLCLIAATLSVPVCGGGDLMGKGCGLVVFLSALPTNIFSTSCAHCREDFPNFFFSTLSESGFFLFFYRL